MNNNQDIISRFIRWVGVKIYLHQNKALFLSLRKVEDMPVPKRVQLVPIEKPQSEENTVIPSPHGTMTQEDNPANLPNEDEQQDAQVKKHTRRDKR